MGSVDVDEKCKIIKDIRQGIKKIAIIIKNSIITIM
jgi:hypothetical protein